MTAFRPELPSYTEFPQPETEGMSPENKGVSGMYKTENLGFNHDGMFSAGSSGDAPPSYGMVHEMSASAPQPVMYQQPPPQQPPPQQPPPQQPQIIQVINQGGNIQGPCAVGMDPMRLQCPACHQFIKTAVNRKSVCKTHLCALLLCVLGCWLCCCFPYCGSSYRNAVHTCPNCSTYLGTYYT